MKNHNCQLLMLLAGMLIMAINATHANAQQEGKKLLLALSKANHTLAIVDPATLKVLGRVPVGEDPHEVVASSDGKVAYVAIYGGGALHEVNVIDLVAQKALDNIDTRPLFGPHDVTFVQGKLWFTAEGSKAVGRYDPQTKSLDWSMGTGQNRTHMLYVTHDAKRIYTTNISSGSVSILIDSLLQPGRNAPPGAKPRSEWFQTVVGVSRGVEGFDVSPDGTHLWTAAGEDGTISVVNLMTKKLESKIDAKAFGANRLKFTLDGKLAFISSLSTGDIFIYETATQKQIKKLNLGKGAAGILMDPDGSRVFIAYSADNYIAVVDLKKLELAARLDIGGVPDGMAWSISR